MARRRRAGNVKSALGLTFGVSTLALGARVAEGVGGPLAGPAGSTFQAAGAFLPTVGTLYGAKMVMGQLQKKRKRVGLM